MSRGATSRMSHPGESEYFTDWRVVWGLVGVVALLIVAPAITRHWVVRLWPTIVLPSSKIVAVRATPTVVNAAAINESAPANSSPIVVLTPWISPEGNVSATPTSPLRNEEPSRREAEQRKRSTRDEPIASQVAKSKEKSLPAFGQHEFELQEDLAKRSVEIAIDTGKLNPPSSGKKPVSVAQLISSEDVLFELVAASRDLQGLPLRKGPACRKEAKALALMSDISRTLGRRDAFPGMPGRGMPRGFDSDPEQQMAFELSCVAKIRNQQWHCAESVSTLVQILQVTSYAVRLELVKILASIEGPEASAALVNRALFELSPIVRKAALEALKSRTLGDDEHEQLVRGLRYCWAPIADHAAGTIVALQLRDMLPRLIDLADEPDPTALFLGDDGQWRRKELVRVNHLRNCVLCHAVSRSTSDPVRGVIPKPGEPLPTVYYGSPQGDSVRADITYLTQDFSVMQIVADRGKWPREQRFDYFERTRRLRGEEVRAEEVRAAEFPRYSYPQRDAVLLAIRGLREEDAK